MKSLTCSACGAEVRYGTRGRTTDWLHREEVDHPVALGYVATDEDKARWAAEMVKPRARISSAAAKHCPTYQDLWPLEVYTTAEQDILRDPDATRRKVRLTEFRGEDPDYVEPIPEPEIPCHPIEVTSFAPRSGIRQITNLIERTDGWELVSIAAARGPYMGADGKVLSISDAVLVRARGLTLDSGRPIAVASWRDGKFDFAYTGIFKDGIVTTSAANSDALKAWIKDPS